VMHLRSLPAPPQAARRADIAELAERASDAGLTPELRNALDCAVYSAFEVTGNEAAEIAAFVRELSPGAGLTVPFA